MSLIVRDSGRRWLNGVIPCKSDMSVNVPLQNLITQAQQAWEAVTPVRFILQTNEPDFILYRNVPGAPRCSSAAGRKGGAQELKCNNAFSLGALVHELGHAIGLQHEHQRQDRDASMAVSAAAIAQQPQDFARLDGEQMVGAYDLTSVMHYSWSTAASQQPLSKITPVGPAAWPNPNQPSPGDGEGVRFMYGIVLAPTPIAVHRRHAGHMELWVVDADGIVRGAWFDGTWQTWYQLPERTFPQRGSLAVLGRHRDHMELFGVDTNVQLQGIWWDGNWHDWYTLGAPAITGLPPGTPALPPGAPLAVRSRFRDHMEVWVVAADRQVHSIWWDGSTWQGWNALAGALFPAGSPLAVHTRHDDHMEIWGIDESGTLRGNWWNGSWQGWYSLPTPSGSFNLVAGGNIAVLGRNEDHMEVWSIGGDDRLHGISWDSNWQQWYTLDGPVSFPAGGPLIALSRNDNHMEVWAVTDADRLQGIWWSGNWNQWYLVDQTPVARGTPLAASSRNDDHMEVWCVAPADPAGAQWHDVGVQGVWWDGQWHPFYRVT
jgi:Astacin (Peptidase family M12A)